MIDHDKESFGFEKYRLSLCRPSLAIPECRYDELLTQTATRFPERVAIVQGEVSLSFRALDSLVNSGARILRELLGLSTGTVVGVIMETCPEALIAYQASSRAGAIVLPLNPLHREQELAHQIDDSGAAVLVIPARLYQLAKQLQEVRPQLRRILWYGRSPAAGAPPAESHLNRLLAATSGEPLPGPSRVSTDLLALPYSSGTTGAPKGVMLTHQNLVANALQFINAHGVTDLDIILDGLPLLLSMHMGGGIAAGATQVMLSEWNARHLLETVQRHGVTQVYTVTPMITELNRLPDLEQWKLPNVKFITGGASSLPAEVARKTEQRLGIPVMQGFGLTEASPLTHAALPAEGARRSDVCGLPVANTEQRIVDIETGEQELPIGETGQLCVRGPQVMAGYFKAPEASRTVLRNGWLYTGDLCWLDEHGYLHYVDRLKDVIKNQGHTVSPSELEAVLRQHADVADCAVIGIQVAHDEQRPMAFVVLSRGRTAEADELRSFINARVADYKQVVAVRFIEQIPRNGAGKALRRLLSQRASAELPSLP